MAFTEEQEEILKRIIEAFQNGKKITDLPRFTTNGQSAYDLPIETIMPVGGRSGRIRAGELNDALNAALNANMESLMQKTAFADAPMISLDTQCLAGWNGRVINDTDQGPVYPQQIQLSSLRIKNASYYIDDKGCKIVFFRKIKQINNIDEYNPDIPTSEDAHYFNYKRKKHKGWRLWGAQSLTNSAEAGWTLDRFSLDQTGKVLYEGKPLTADFLLTYKTVEKTFQGEKYEVMRVLWGAKSKEFALTKTNAPHIPMKFPLALAFCDDEGNIISNIVPFHVLVYYGHPINQDDLHATDKWNFCFTY